MWLIEALPSPRRAPERAKQYGMLLNAGATVDRYMVEGLLGEGGIAEVYLARHSSLGVLRALKIVRVGSDVIRERLMLEGRIQARLNHPNVVSVVDVLTSADGPVLVMEFVPGPSLYALLYERRLRLAQSTALAQGILAGVAAAHKQGLVHRDLKPANILIDPSNGRLVPRVADFGLAKVLLLDEDLGGPHTRTNATMGTPAYMAPEQQRNSKNVDARADVFALGAILYELVTGQPAFPLEDLFEILKAAREESYAPLRPLVPALGERRIGVIEAALRASPGDRPANAGAMLDAWGAETIDVGVWGDLPALADRLKPSIEVGSPTPAAAEPHPLDPGGVSSPALPRPRAPSPQAQAPVPASPRPLPPLAQSPAPQPALPSPRAPLPPARPSPPPALPPLYGGEANAPPPAPQSEEDSVYEVSAPNLPRATVTRIPDIRPPDPPTPPPTRPAPAPRPAAPNPAASPGSGNTVLFALVAVALLAVAGVVGKEPIEALLYPPPPVTPTPVTPIEPTEEEKKQQEDIAESDEQAKSMEIVFEGTVPQYVDVLCGAVRERAEVEGGVVKLANLPRRTECLVSAKGGVSASSIPLDTGGKYTCTIIVGIMRCR